MIQARWRRCRRARAVGQGARAATAELREVWSFERGNSLLTNTPAAAHALVRRFQIAEQLDDAVQLFKVHLPYHESDHILAIAANLFVGGTCLEDQANLQHSEAVRRMLGARPDSRPHDGRRLPATLPGAGPRRPAPRTR